MTGMSLLAHNLSPIGFGFAAAFLFVWGPATVALMGMLIALAVVRWRVPPPRRGVYRFAQILFWAGLVLPQACLAISLWWEWTVSHNVLVQSFMAWGPQFLFGLTAAWFARRTQRRYADEG